MEVSVQFLACGDLITSAPFVEKTIVSPVIASSPSLKII